MAAAMTVAAGVGAVVFYIARALLARDRITPPALAETDDEAQE